jgi:general secretion pathway protein D
MHTHDRLLKMTAAAALVLAFAAAGGARTRKGNSYLAQGERAEVRKDWDTALDWYEKALQQDPSDIAYQIAVKRVRFQAGQAHVDAGEKLRQAGEVEKALAEFQRAYAIDPSSAVAEQQVKSTLEIIERNRKKELPPEQRALSGAELERLKEKEELSRLEPPPELKPLARQPINLRMSNQPPKILFETVAKLAGINVVFDPDYANDPNARRNSSVELTNSTLEDALDYVATMTHSFWKPLSANAILVTQDTMPKRRDYEDSVVKVFYLTNLTTPQELQEISTVIRTVCDLKKVFNYSSLSALVVRGSPDQVLLAEKLVNDLDKPKPEVVVDMLVMEANRNRTRNLAAAISSNGTSGGINTTIQFTPRNPVLLGGSTGGSTDGSATPTPTPSVTQQLMSLARISRLSTNDFSITMPGALLQATMGDSNTKVLQSPQVRAASGQKASLRIGERFPIASGGIQPFGGTTGGYGGLYQNFQFVDIGVNVDITPTVHGDKEVTLKVVLEISSRTGQVDIGGISQPVIGQRKVEHEIRIREGEVSLLGGLMQDQDVRSTSGIPGLSSIPVLRRLFSSETVERNRNELLIALIPHIVRTPGITALNLRTIDAGTDQYTHLTLAPREEPPAAPKPPAPPAEQPAPPAPAPAPVTPAPAPPSPPAATHLLFRPWSADVKPGSTVTLQLDVENARDLAAAPFHLKFDPQLLKLQAVQAGPFLSSDGQTIIFTRNILNDTGDATVNLNRMPGAPGITGSGTLAELTFQAVKPGKAMVTFSALGARDTRMQPVSQDVPHAEITIK